MFKRIVSLILSLLLLISIIGCGKSNTSSFKADANDFSFDFGENNNQQTGDFDSNEEVSNATNNNSSKGNTSNNSSKNNNSSKFSSSNNQTDDTDDNTGNTTNSSKVNSSSNTTDKTECKHSYKEVDCEQPQECKLCGNIAKDALGHKFVNGTCSVCKATYLEWYSNKEISITKSEVKGIIDQQFKKPKNVIMMIGDGMGPNDIAYTQKKSSQCFDFGLVLNQIKNTGYATTRSYDSTVTDSAAGGTALATGFKTKNGYVGMSPTGEKLTNITEIARQKGKKVGIVTNDDIVGATPSAFGVHVDSRSSAGYIAKSFVQFAPDVLIGQGRNDFSGLNLKKFVVADDFSKFNDALNKNIRCDRSFLGFFSQNTSKDKEAVNTLAYCTEMALNRLKKNSPNGFFLMVENTTCDAAGHAVDLAGKMTGVITLDRAVATVLKFMKNNPDTLLIITSDHDNGNLTEDGKFGKEAGGHTEINVRTFAVGYGAEYFNGTTVDNTDIAKFAINAVSN